MWVGALFATRASRMQIIHRWKTRYDGLHTDQAGQLGQFQDGSVKRGEDFFVPEPSEGESRSIITVLASSLSKARQAGVAPLSFMPANIAHRYQCHAKMRPPERKGR